MNKNQYSKGQSLLELIVAIGIFSLVITGLTFFIFDSYLANRLSYDLTKADFLAEEGVEAVRSIRDNNFSDLTTGTHSLAISGGHWIFQGIEENLSSQLNGGKRVVSIEDIDSNRKKITSTVSWKFTENRPEEIKLVSYLTNWQKGLEIRKPTAYTDPSPRKTNNPSYPATNAYDYPDGTTFAATLYDHDKNPSITFHSWQAKTQAYSALVLKYRYHAEAGTNDKYAVAYSTTGCNGLFTNIISPTSASAPDTTISVNLSPSQDLSLLCLKIYTQKVASPDGKNIYTRDIWTEGSY
jgi:Tfp pilus assembly protein PilV